MVQVPSAVSNAMIFSVRTGTLDWQLPMQVSVKVE
jgi:hypothetical protein